MYNADLAPGGLRSVVLYNIKGNEVTDLTKNINLRQHGLQQVSCTLQDEATGLYMLVCTCGSTVVSTKVLKQ